MESRPLNNRAILRRVKKVEERFSPKVKDDLVVVWSFGSSDEPHGKYGYRKVHLYTGLKEACTEEEEFEFLREAYESIPLQVRKRTQYWSSFQNFLAYRRCKCPVHRADEKTKGAEIQRMLRKYDDVLEKVAKQKIEAREQELLTRTS
jgi:hypothetical protein